MSLAEMALSLRRVQDSQRLQQMLFGFSTTQIIYVAVKLGIVDCLSEEPLTTEEIAQRTGTQPRELGQVMRALAGLGIVRAVDGGYELTSLGEPLATRGPVRAMALSYGGLAYRAYEGLLHALQTGETAFEHVFGTGYYEYLASHPDSAQDLNGWMAQSAGWVGDVINAIDWQDVRQMVDVGGAGGSLLASALAANPHLRGILFDLPQALEGAEARLAATGVADRARLVPGDFFESVPAGGDLYTLTRVLINWDDEPSRAILRQLRAAMAADGRLVVVDFMTPEGERSLTSLLNSVNVMVLFQARQRTEAEYCSLLTSAGFAVDRMTPLASNPLMAMIDARPV